jgi:hypothetical protein
MNIRGECSRWVFASVTEIMTLISIIGKTFLPTKHDKTCQRMKKLGLLGLVLLLSLTGCEFIGDVFGAGVYLGVFMSVIVVVIIIIFVAKIFRK